MEQLIVLLLATWALSWLLVDGHGPKNILDIFRHWIGVRYNENGNRYGITWLGDLFNCEICLSVWLSIPLAMAMYQQQWHGSIGTTIVSGIRFVEYALAAVGFVIVVMELINGNDR